MKTFVILVWSGQNPDGPKPEAIAAILNEWRYQELQKSLGATPEADASAPAEGSQSYDEMAHYVSPADN